MDETETIDLKVGETQSLDLPNLSMSGFTWSLETRSGGERVEAELKTEPSSRVDSPPLAGAAPPTRLVVRGVAAGEAEMLLVQKRAWETRNLEERLVRISVG